MPSKATALGAETPVNPKATPASRLLILPPPTDRLVLLFLCLSLAFLALAATRAAVCGLICALVHATLALAHGPHGGTAAAATRARELGSVHALAAAAACLAALEVMQDALM